MKRMPLMRPTDHYEEKIKQIDEKLCELIKQRKEISNNNPGYPPFEYIDDWSLKFDLNEEQLKSVFSTLWNEKIYKTLIEPEDFQKNMPVLKSIEADDRLYSVISVRQFSNSSVVNFNVDYIDWEMTCNAENQPRFHHYELFIDERYECRMANGTGSNRHFHYDFIVSPALPNDISGIELIFKEYNRPFGDKQIGQEIVIRL